MADQTLIEKLFPLSLRGPMISLGYHPGWTELVVRVLMQTEQHIRMELSAGTALEDCIRVVQIKDKWGQLRIYLDRQVPEISALCIEVEELSGHICRICGSDDHDHDTKGPKQCWYRR